MTSGEKFKDVFKWIMSFFAFIILWLLLVFLFSGAFLIPYSIILGKAIGDVDFEVDDVFIAFFQFAAILSTILAQRVVLKRKANALPFLAINVKQLLFGGAVGTAFMVSFVLVQFFFGYASYHFVGISFSVFTYLLIYILVAINEELLFRGFLIPYLSEKLNVFFVVLISSLLFGLAHLANSHFTLLGFSNIMLSGILMALFFLRFKNLSAPIALHFAWNFFQGPVFGYSVSGHEGWSLSKVNFINKSEILTGGLFGAEGSAVLIPMSLFAIVIFLLISRRTKSISRLY